VAFFGILSLFPALLALAAALGAIGAVAGEEAAREAEAEVVGFLQRVLAEDAGETVDAVRELFREASPGLLTVSLAGALWAASRGVAAVIRALDVAYGVDEHRGWLRLRALALGLAVGTVLVAAFLLVALVLGPLLGGGREVADWLGFGGAFATFWDWVRWPAVVVGVVAWATTVFHVAPDRRSPWRRDLPGAVLTATLWILLSIGFRAYLSLAGDTNQVLGVLGGSLVVLLWLYLLAIGLLLGGELNAVLVRRAGVPREVPAP
jgi:membrane protein